MSTEDLAARQEARERGVAAAVSPIDPQRKTRGFESAHQLFIDAIGDILRTDADASDAEVSARLAGFRQRVEAALLRPRGRPSKFQIICRELKLGGEDCDLLFYITLREMLHSALQGLSSTRPFETSIEAANETIDGETAGEEDDPEANAGWVSQQTLFQRVWQNIALELALSHRPAPEAATHGRVMRNTAKSAKARGAIRGKLLHELSKTRKTTSEERRIFAGELVQLVMEQFSTPWFQLRQLDGPHSLTRLVPTLELQQRLGRLSDRARLIDRYAPLVAAPRSWGRESGVHQGGYHVQRLEFFKFWQKNQRIREFLNDCDAMDLDGVFGAVNALQDTAWRLNQRIWNVAADLLQMAGVPSGNAPGSADPRLAALEPRWREWLLQPFLRAKDGSSGPGARLAGTLTLNTLLSLQQEEQFYYAYQADSRGRIYPVTGWLSPQGEDLSRALLEFATAKPLTAAGARHLAIHGSQQIRRDIILADAPGPSQRSPNHDERLHWIERHSAHIVACAEAPLENTWWRDVAGKARFQFLAFCFAWRDYVRHGEQVPCALPIHVDGTCNGLQHIAALTGNRALAASTNLLPGEPQDIYTMVASLVKRDVAAAQPKDTLLAFIEQHASLLDRELAKPVVMIIPYGAGADKYKWNIGAHLLRAVTGDATLCRDFERHFGISPVNGASAPEQKREYRRAVRQKVDELANCLGDYFDRAIDAAYPVVGQFKRSLLRVIRPVVQRNIPLLWVAPSGLPVLQKGFRQDGVEMESKLFGRLRFTLQRTLDDISVKKQQKGILPNLIHSLDSAHLVETIRLARTEGITSFSMVHDSFGTHAADMEAMTQCLRQAFVEVYTREPRFLPRFEAWMQALTAAADGLAPAFPFELHEGEALLLGLARQWAEENRRKADSDGQQDAGTPGPGKRRSSGPDAAGFAAVLGDEFDIRDVKRSEYFFS